MNTSRMAVAGVLIGLTAGVPTAQGDDRPKLTGEQSLAKTNYFRKREKANAYKARERVGGPFTVWRAYCGELDVGEFTQTCRYEFSAREPFETLPDGTRKFKACKVLVKVSRLRGPVRGKRSIQSCRDHIVRPRP